MNKFIALLLLSSASCIFRPNFPEELCGDGDVDINEQCDDANQIETDGCHNNCTVPGCGDGFVDPGEICFDPAGTTNLGDIELTTDFLVGKIPGTMRFADLNDDGNLDYVVSAPDNDQLISGLGNGNGLFQNAKATPLLQPLGVSLADVNGDQLPDAIVSRPLAANGGAVSVLLGLGDGLFGVPVDIKTGNNPLAIIAEDLNNDGFIDVPVFSTIAVFLDDGLEIFSGDGLGGFTRSAQDQILLGLDLNATDIVVADIDENGQQDLITANSAANREGNSASIFLQSDLNTFGPPTQIIQGSGTFGVTVGDFNNDGALDIVAANNLGGSLTISFQEGRDFVESEIIISGFIGLQRVVSTDLDLDGNLDLIATVNNEDPSFESDVLLLFGNGDGSFDDVLIPGLNLLSAGVGSFDIFVGDLNGDDAADIAVLNVISDDISIILANP
jgi:cysteine-rich repeat protein